MPRRKQEEAALIAFGKRLRQVREEAGMTQVAVADRVGVRPKAISLIESGDAAPTLTTMLQLARALGVSPAVLFQFGEGVASAAPESTDEADLLVAWRGLGVEDRRIVRVMLDRFRGVSR